jgi:hypothetical protein
MMFWAVIQYAGSITPGYGMSADRPARERNGQANEKNEFLEPSFKACLFTGFFLYTFAIQNYN